jgi:hypothetical protein
VQTTPSFTAGQPTKLFDSGVYVGVPGRSYDMSRDGQRFLVVKDADIGDRGTPPAAMVMVLNWIEELKARVPAANRR